MRFTAATLPGRPGHANEDWAGADSAGVAVVLDGLSEAGDTGCVHGTPWYVRQLGTRLLAAAGEPGRDLAGALALAIEEVRDLHGGACDLTHPGSPGATVAAARHRDGGWEYLVLSDAVAVFATGNGGPAVVTDRSVSAHLPAALSAGTPRDAAGSAALIRHLQRLRNQPGGYWVAQSDPEAARHAVTGTVPGAGPAILLSDGAALAVTDFGALDWTGLVTLVTTRGPAELLAVTRELERTDRDARVWPRFKTHDDATVVVCEPG